VFRSATIAGAGVWLSAAMTAGQSPAPQHFRAGVDVVVVEATVVDKAGKVVAGLEAADFTAEIGGKPRPVVSAEWVAYASVRPGEQRPDLDISTNIDALPGRRILLVIDQISLKPESRAVLEAAKRWVATLGASDRVGLIALPPPGLSIEPTTDHAQVIEALSRVVPIGALPPPYSQHSVSIWEAFRINELDASVRSDVVLRECKDDPICPMEIDVHARALSMDAQVHVQPVLQSLRALMRNLGALPGPKHIVLMSAGWPLPEKDAGSELTSLASDAAASNVVVHTFTAEQWALAAYRSRAPVITTGVPDKSLLLNSVEMMSSLTGGQAARLTGSGDQAFKALNAGLAGYYRLGVRADPEDLDGKPRRIALKVSRAGASLSSYRRLVVGEKPGTPAGTPAAALNEALRSPKALTDLALRATSYVLHPAEPGSHDMRVVLVGDVGHGAAGPATAVAALFDLEGKPVTAVETVIELPSTGSGALTLALRAPPAPYILRLAVRDVDGGIGTLERGVDARWKKTGDIETPGLVVFRALGPEAPTPLFRAVTTAETLVAQVPFGGTPASPPQVIFEVKAEGSAAVLVRRVARVAATASGATVAEGTIAASALPPGRYTLSATIRPGTAAPFTRSFVVEAAAAVPAPPPATSTPAGSVPPASAAVGRSPTLLVEPASVPPAE
jgi:VWFA-related protein